MSGNHGNDMFAFRDKANQLACTMLHINQAQPEATAHLANAPIRDCSYLYAVQQHTASLILGMLSMQWAYAHPTSVSLLLQLQHILKRAHCSLVMHPQ